MIGWKQQVKCYVMMLAGGDEQESDVTKCMHIFMVSYIATIYIFVGDVQFDDFSKIFPNKNTSFIIFLF